MSEQQFAETASGCPLTTTEPHSGVTAQEGARDSGASAHQSSWMGTVQRSARSGVGGSASTDRYVVYVILLLFVVNVFNYMDRMALSVLAPVLKIDLGLSDAQLGLLTGFAFALFYAVCGIPIGCWADRGIRRNIIALALATWSVMTALCGLAQNFWQLFLARVGVGVGESGCLPSAQSMLCDYVPSERRSGVFAIHTFGLYMGMFAGMAFAGWFGETLGWRGTFLVLGLPGLLLAVVVRLTLREPMRGRFDCVGGQPTSVSFVSTVRTLLGCRIYRLLLLFAVLDNFVQSGVNQWLPSYYVRMSGLSLSSIGVYLGLAMGVGAGTGLLIGGFLANKLAKSSFRLPLLICAAASFLAFPLALGALAVSSPYVSIFLVSLTALFWTATNGPVLAVLYGATAPQMRATAGAINIFAIAVLGLGLGPFCVGLLSDALTPLLGAEALRYALLVPISVHPATIIVLYVVSRGLAKRPDAISAQPHEQQESPGAGTPTKVTVVG